MGLRGGRWRLARAVPAVFLLALLGCLPGCLIVDNTRTTSYRSLPADSKLHPHYAPPSAFTVRPGDR
jgi:hypothetical protein